MKKISFRLFIILIVLVSTNLCKPKKKDEIDPQLLSVLLSQSSGVNSSCQKFLLSEATCVGTPDNAVTGCPSLITALKSKITPSDKSSDSVAELYFNCFTDVNLIYTQGIGCQKSSFNTNVDFRKAQRSTTTGSTQNANAAWKLQFNNCASIDNGTPPASSGLKETGTKLSADPFI
ncbi:hypothetical protein [Leptospira ilyithenensis]|uniref:Uncharacterized protein n=1 Tax=Leptospira ilyithenensis TaxID=2484901 RepID=A0A4R9LKN0_9LEPT|nr:hypothetical protein [Leptospira ilyithenensis]TGN06564.1 hypothetical protein EHS11_19640 [Leptospira ilyithenensis]